MTYRQIIIGLGNPILGDDGVGWQVAAEVEKRLSGSHPSRPPIEVDCLAVGGLDLMERLVGYDRAILIDAIFTGTAAPGHIHRFELEDLPELAAAHVNSTHNTTLHNALRVGRSMGASLPSDISIVAIEAENLYEFTEALTHPVAAAIPAAADIVLRLIYN